MSNFCEWTQSFDGHYNLGCVNETGKRGNQRFLYGEKNGNLCWDFKYCPYCGNKIKKRMLANEKI